MFFKQFTLQLNLERAAVIPDVPLTKSHQGHVLILYATMLASEGYTQTITRSFNQYRANVWRFLELFIWFSHVWCRKGRVLQCISVLAETTVIFVRHFIH